MIWGKWFNQISSMATFMAKYDRGLSSGKIMSLLLHICDYTTVRESLSKL